MNYGVFLNKDDQRCYFLLKYLEKSVTLSEPLLKIQEDMGFSSFILKKTIEKTQEDIEQLGLEESFKLSASDGELSLEIDGNYSSKVLLSYYITNSLGMGLVISFFKNKYRSMEEFAEKNHVSYSVAYSTLQDLKKKLKKYQIFFEKKKLTGNQKNINLFLYNLFSITNLAYEELYTAKTIQKAEQLMRTLSEKYVFTAYEQRKLFHYLAIFIENDGKMNTEIEAGVTSFFNEICFQEFQSFYPKASETFTYSMIFWLYLYGKLEKDCVNLESNEEINALNQQFISSFEDKFTKLDGTVKKALIEELSKIHFNVLYYPIDIFEQFEMNITFFKQNYPEFYFHSLEYVNQKSKEYERLAKVKVFLFFNYLMLLITKMPIQLVNKPINVLIDFSYGEGYNRFIKKNLDFYVNLNVSVIEPEEKIQPDIVITNVNNLYHNEGVNVVVWLDPPRSVDWVNLTNVMLDIKKAEYEAKIESI